jgi:DNA-binding NtrC family response regulator
MNETRPFPRQVKATARSGRECKLAPDPIESMIGKSSPFHVLVNELKEAAAWNREPVLLVGERGAGKEVAAHALHLWSTRRAEIFLPVSMPAMYDDLAADELFGHEPNSFTGAMAARLGAFARADRGTLFLDEIADMRLSTQAALLRVIESGEFKSIGADLPRRVDVRVIAATNKNLTDLIRGGRFRADLYDRLSVFEIRVPPLRERREDIPLLATHFLAEFAKKAGCALADAPCSACAGEGRALCASASFYERLQSHDWPGNVRELRKKIIRVRLAHPKEPLEACHLQLTNPMSPDPSAKAAPADALDRSLRSQLRQHIEEALISTGFNVSATAKRLDLPRSTLRDHMKRLGIGLP